MKKIFKKEKQLLSNILYMAILQGSNILLPLILIPYLIQVLGSEKFGLIMFANAMIIYFNSLTSFGFNISATREISINREDRYEISKIFINVMTIKILLLIISSIILFLILVSFDRFTQDWHIFALYMGTVVGQVLFPIWYFQGIEKMKYITYINILSKILIFILVILFIKETNDYIYVPLIYSIGAILAGVIAFSIALRNIDLTFPIFKELNHMVKDSFNIFISNASINLYTNTNVFVLGLFTNYQIVGIYAGFEKIVLAIKGLNLSLYQAIFPWLSKKENIKDLINKMTIPISIIIMLVTFIIYYFSENIVNLIFNSTEMLEHIYMLHILLFVPFISALNMLFNFLYLNSLKKYKTRMRIMLIAGSTSIVLGTIFTYIFGANGTITNVVIIELLLLILGYKAFLKTNNFKGLKC